MSRRSKKKSAFGYTSNNRVRLVRGGAAYFDTLLEIINRAAESIHLQTYIYADDETGRKVGDALIAAAGRGVKVFLIIDGYASRTLSSAFIKSLSDGGVNFRFFEPIFKSRHFYFGRRLHHKVIVVDARMAMVGGVNISNHYNDMPGHPGWLDFALFAEGDIAKELCLLCCKTWKGFQAEKNVTPCNPPELNIPEEEKSVVRMRRNDWVNSKNQISKTYIEMLTRSQSHIIILCSYFLPGSIIRKSLKRAAKRGVKVNVIVAGKSDLPIAKNAERWMYDWLLRNNIGICEYQSNILHGKIAVCDSQWLTIGSYNINDISAYASVELNLDVNDPDFAKEVESRLKKIMQEDCLPISKELHAKKKKIFVQFFRWCSYHIFRATFYLFTFYFKQHR
ncbi:MAG: phospholipase D-like domain-containing protein [Ferruginibacter sp.]